MTLSEQDAARVAEIEERWVACHTTIPGAPERFITNAGFDVGDLLRIIRRLTDAPDAAEGA